MPTLIYARQVLVPLPCATLGVIGQVASSLTPANNYDEDKVQRNSRWLEIQLILASLTTKNVANC